MSRDGSKSCQATLHVKLDELVGSWRLILLYSEQILLYTMDKDNVDSLTIKELCKVDLDGTAIFVHGTLAHDGIHGLENHILNQHLFI